MELSMEEGYVWYEQGCSLCQCPECKHIQHAPGRYDDSLVWMAGCESCGVLFELVERGY
jgi:hypothetical protein